MSSEECVHKSSNPSILLIAHSSQVQNNVATDVAVDVPKLAPESRKRPRLDLSTAADGNRERKRGKSMFGIVLGTLNKAKIEDKERNASEAVCPSSVYSHIVNHSQTLLLRPKNGI